MSKFSKTIVVDADQSYQGYQNIKDAAADPEIINNGGTIIVEAGVYQIYSGDTIIVPSNTTIVGRGNVELQIKDNIYAFNNYHYSSGSDFGIKLSGFKISVNYIQNSYTSQIFYMRNVSNCLFENISITAAPTQIGNADAPSNSALYFHGESIEQCCSNNIISKCFINNIHFAINFHSYCINNSICNNYITNCSNAIFINLSDNNIIKNNVLSRSYGNPNVSIGKSNNVCVIGNQINETTGYSHYVQVDDKLVKEAVVSHGIYPSGTEGCVFLGNIVSRNGEHGIKPRFHSDGTADKFNAIVANVCDGNGRGVLDDPDLHVPGDGIFLQGKAEHHTIFSNVSVNNSDLAIRVQADDKVDQSIVESPKLPAIFNNVTANVAVMHSGSSDCPISVEDPSNNLAFNIIGHL